MVNAIDRAHDRIALLDEVIDRALRLVETTVMVQQCDVHFLRNPAHLADVAGPTAKVEYCLSAQPFSAIKCLLGTLTQAVFADLLSAAELILHGFKFALEFPCLGPCRDHGTFPLQ